MLGANHMLTLSFQNGFAIHHGQLLQSFKEVVEDCVTKEIVPLVICTSTLAEGVNMPIKTLVVHAAQKGESKLSQRDFLNLAGRSGRASRETSGNVIFVRSEENQRMVNRYAGRLNPENCWSAILLAAASMVDKQVAIDDARLDPDYKSVFDAVESFLMLSFADRGNTTADLREFFKGTFAYFQLGQLGHHSVEAKCFEIFSFTMESIEKLGDKKKLFARTGESIETNERLESVFQGLDDHENLDDDEIIRAVVIGLHTFIGRGKLTVDETLKVCRGWMGGQIPLDIHNLVVGTISARRKAEAERAKKAGRRTRAVSWEIDNTTSFIQSALAYDLANRLGSLAIFADDALDGPLKQRLLTLQKKTKYGLDDLEEISFLEMGLSDRVLCQQVNSAFQGSRPKRKTKGHKREWIRENVEMLQESVFEDFPAYFSRKLEGI